MNTFEAFRNRALESEVTARLIRDLMFTFYGKVRSDPVLGPIFTIAIGTDWDAHIERIISFWLTATRLGRGYDGTRFMSAHLQHSFIRAEHLPIWLALFKQTVRERCSAQQAAVLVDIAERMAENIAISLARRDRS